MSVLSFLGCARDKAVELYNKASVPGAVQKKALAFTRAAVGIASISFFPGQAVAGAGLAAVAPDTMSKVVTFTEGAITGLWNSMSPKQRFGAAAAGITITYFGFGLLSIPASIFAAKLGAELALRNHKKEEIAAVAKQMEAEHAE